MNTFVSKKLGEVLAFARVGTDTLDKARGLTKILEEEGLNSAREGLESLESSIISLPSLGDGDQDMDASSAESERTILDMRDTYIDGEWNEASEVLEWMGFYAGAAIVHWQLLAGAAAAMEDTDLAELCDTALDFYGSLFISDEELLREIGAARSADEGGIPEMEE